MGTGELSAAAQSRKEESQPDPRRAGLGNILTLNTSQFNLEKYKAGQAIGTWIISPAAHIFTHTQLQRRRKTEIFIPEAEERKILQEEKGRSVQYVNSYYVEVL